MGEEGVVCLVWFLLPEIYFNICFVHGFFAGGVLSPLAEVFICNIKLMVLTGRGTEQNL